KPPEQSIERIRGSDALKSADALPVWHDVSLPADIHVCLTFFHSAATCLHSPTARRAASRKMSRGSGGPTNGTWLAAVKSWAAATLPCYAFRVVDLRAGEYRYQIFTCSWILTEE